MGYRTKIAIFSRGKGRGHTLPAIGVGETMRKIDPNLEIVFISYGTGARFFRQMQIEVVDLNLADDNQYLVALFRCLEVLRELRPDVVVAQEEFAAIPAAKSLGIPVIYWSSWMPVVSGYAMDSLTYADSAVITENPGIFPRAPGMNGKIRYTGPMIRDVAYHSENRAMARASLGIELNKSLVTILGSGGIGESKSPLIRVYAEALEMLGTNWSTHWVAGKDQELVQEAFGGRDDVFVYDFIDPIARLMAASDVVLTKGTRGASLDAAAVGVPSVSLSYGWNPIDDILVPRIQGNIALNARAVDGSTLASYLRLASSQKRPPSSFTTVASVAKTVLDGLRELVSCTT